MMWPCVPWGWAGQGRAGLYNQIPDKTNYILKTVESLAFLISIIDLIISKAPSNLN